MRVVILGCGRVGSELGKMLDDEGHEVCLIDKTVDSFTRLGPKFRGKRVQGIGIDPDVLERAEIKDADAFAAVTNGDNTNIMSALIAKENYGVKDVVVRIYDPHRTHIYHQLGLNTICPTMIGAEQIYKLFVKGETLRTHSVGDGTYQLIEVRVGPSIHNQKIQDLSLPDEALISVVLVEGAKAIPPTPERILQPDDRLVIICRPEQSRAIQATLGK